MILQSDHLLTMLGHESCHFTTMVGFKGFDLLGQLNPEAAFLTFLDLCPKVVAQEPCTEARYCDPRVKYGSNNFAGDPEAFYFRSVLWKDEYGVALVQFHVRCRNELGSFINGLKLISLHLAVTIEDDTFF